MQKKIIGFLVCMLLTTGGFGSVFGSANVIKKEKSIEKPDISCPSFSGSGFAIGSPNLCRPHKTKLQNIDENDSQAIPLITESYDEGYWEFTPPFDYDYCWKIAMGGGNNVAKCSVNRNTGIGKVYTYHSAEGGPYGWANAGIDIWQEWTAQSSGETTFGVYGKVKGSVKNDYDCSSMIWGWIQIYDGYPESHEEPLVKKKVFEYGTVDTHFEGFVSFSVQKDKLYSILFNANAGSDGYGGTTYADFMDSGQIKLEKIIVSEKPKLELSPDIEEYNFGEVKEGNWPRSPKFKLYNRGGIAKDVKIELEGDTDYGSGFGVEGNTYTHELYPDEYMEFNIVFMSGKPLGNKRAVLKVTSSNCDCTHISVIFKGKTVEDNCCFPAGTKITMADGTYKNIENIRIGDRIMSYNPDSGEFGSWCVKMLGNPMHPMITINDGLIQATVDHPFYVKKPDGCEGWAAYDVCDAEDAITYNGDILQLKVGDKLLTLDGKWIKVDSITYSSDPVQTYNILSFSGTKTYFANGILVYEEHPPHCMTDYLLRLLGGKYPKLEQLLRSCPLFEKLINFLP